MARILDTIEGVQIIEEMVGPGADGRPSSYIHFTADADIDADGANGQSRHPLSGKPLFAYGPGAKGGSGLDDLRNIKLEDLVQSKPGQPLVVSTRDFQGNTVKGYYSKTAYAWPGLSVNDPNRYLDSCAVPYIVVPPIVRRATKGIVLGCKARVSYKGRITDAVVGDIGPSKRIGEISIAAADALGINSNPRTGGTEAREVLFELWPGVRAVVDEKTYELIKA